MDTLSSRSWSRMLSHAMRVIFVEDIALAPLANRLNVDFEHFSTNHRHPDQASGSAGGLSVARGLSGSICGGTSISFGNSGLTPPFALNMRNWNT